jgi:hypothetical protein
LILKGASPFRTATNSLEITFEILPGTSTYKAPSRTTTKRWVQKIGYYKLMHPKGIASDWMIIVDASIQIGPQKCLIALGCRKGNLPFKCALKLEDLEILGLRIVSKLNAQVAVDFLNEIKLSIGNIIGITIDQGSDLLRGVKDFQLKNPEVRYINDTAHRVANNLRASLEDDERWRTFRVEVTQARRKMQYSSISGLLPPSPREKARFMNVGPLIQWAVDMLILLNNRILTPNLNMEEIKNQIGWLEYYRDDIEIWHQYSQVAAAARDCVRTEGTHFNIVDSFEQAITPIKIGIKGLQFADRISMFLMEQTKGLKPGDCFIGSTEVIESLFGKMKYMEREQTAFGFTSLVLAGIACVGPLDDKIIVEAVTSIKLKDIDSWTGNEIKESIQSQRSKIRNLISALKEKIGEKASGIIHEIAVGF